MLNVSFAHVAHIRSVVALPSIVTSCPGWQFVQVVQLAAFAVVLNVPLAHAVHVRSAVVVPLVATACPGTQFVHATHAVAGLPS